MNLGIMAKAFEEAGVVGRVAASGSERAGVDRLAKAFSEEMLGKEPRIGRGTNTIIRNAQDHALNIVTMPEPPAPYIVRRNNPDAIASREYGKNLTSSNFTTGSTSEMASNIREKVAKPYTYPIPPRLLKSEGSLGDVIPGRTPHGFNPEVLSSKSGVENLVLDSENTGRMNPGTKSANLTKQYGKIFPVKDGDSPLTQVLKVGGESLVDAMDKGLGSRVMRYGALPLGGAAIGAIGGMAGHIVAPNNIEENGFVKSAFMGAATGMALGIAHNFSSAGLKHMEKINGIGKNASDMAWMKKSLGMTKSFTESKAVWGALGIASAAGSVSTNFTRPVNGVV